MDSTIGNSGGIAAAVSAVKLWRQSPTDNPPQFLTIDCLNKSVRILYVEAVCYDSRKWRHIARFDRVSGRCLSVLAWRHRSVPLPNPEGLSLARSQPRKRRTLAYRN